MKSIYALILLLSFMSGVLKPIQPMIEALVFDNDAVASLFEMQEPLSCSCESGCDTMTDDLPGKATMEVCSCNDSCFDSHKLQLDLDYYPIAPEFFNSINFTCYKQELTGFYVYSTPLISITLIPATPPPRS